MTPPQIESRLKRIQVSFNFILAYIFISIFWLRIGRDLGQNILLRLNMERIPLRLMYVVDLLLNSIVIFSIVYLVQREFNKSKDEINVHIKEIKQKEATIKKAHINLKTQNNLISNVLENASILILGLDCDFNILSISNNIEDIASFSKEEINKRHLSTLIDKKDVEELKETIKNKEKATKELELLSKHGKKIYTSGTIERGQQADNKDLEYTLVLLDITQRKLLQKKISYLDSHDPLTSLANRSFLEEEFKANLIENVEKSNPIALLYMELDDFEYMNENFGYHAADRLVIDMAKRLRFLTKEGDLISRISQDKFAIIFLEEQSLEDIEDRIKDIQGKTEFNWLYKGEKYIISTTMGVSIYQEDCNDFTGLLRNANIALECAKEDSRGSYVYYSPDNMCGFVNDLTMLSDIKSALVKDEFQMYYQPIKDLRTGEMVGLEALIRWFHPQKKFISTGDFIPVAEKAGLIDEIGDYTINEVFRQKKEWDSLGYNFKKVSINISTMSFSKENFASYFKKKLEDYNLQGEEIVLELTETSFSRYPDIVKKNIDQLKDLKIEIAMDDFGTGYSSLSRLKDLNIDYLKLDRAFIVALLEEDGEAIIKPLISLANALGKKVVAEGIENEEQFSILKRLGCDFGQGYYLAYPMPAENLIKMRNK